MMKAGATLLFIACCMAATGCGTMLEGSMQEIRVHCDPSENIQAVADGKEIVFLNGLVQLDKQRELHFVTFKTDGYYPSTVAFNRDINPFWPIANLIWLPAAPIGWLVDWATGSVYKIEPRDIHVVLRKQERSNQ